MVRSFCLRSSFSKEDHEPDHPLTGSGALPAAGRSCLTKQNIVCVQQQNLSRSTPHRGWVEHNPMEIWSSHGVMNEVIAQSGVDPQKTLRALASPTSAGDHRPVGQRTPDAQCITPSSQCRRTGIMDRRQDPGMADYIRENTGLVPGRHFLPPRSSGSWKTSPVRGKRPRQRGLLFGTVDTWLVWKLTGGKVHVTDAAPTPTAPCCTTSGAGLGRHPAQGAGHPPLHPCPA